ncbi:hypothetical protein G6O67_004380 [Ophiocordyceps sinensis]|uniref:Uncharacterized protein n=1 Tax=Ophiocordyceps sinensis TaxID=72228 RepID=A0A8H4LYN6_9HYPO|nr:hypothetical protein G6O67_004380 [Ophiocordyceps sinensis]
MSAKAAWDVATRARSTAQDQPRKINRARSTAQDQPRKINRAKRAAENDEQQNTSLSALVIAVEQPRRLGPAACHVPAKPRPLRTRCRTTRRYARSPIARATLVYYAELARAAIEGATTARWLCLSNHRRRHRHHHPPPVYSYPPAAAPQPTEQQTTTLLRQTAQPFMASALAMATNFCALAFSSQHQSSVKAGGPPATR